nr:ABC transporter permease [uncultured Clostridium sp.]
MLNVFKNEIYKSLTKGKILVYLIFLTLIISVIGIIIKINILDLTMEDGLIQFLKYNLTFILVKILTPVLLIIITASVIADDYSSGVMKFFLISKIDKKDVIVGKILYLIIITLINTLAMFIIVSIVGGILAQDFSNIFSSEYIKVLNAYMITAFGMLPIVLATAVISLMVDNFNQSIGISISVLIVSLMIDSINSNILGITPTSLISYGYKLVGDISNKIMIIAVILSCSYILLLTLSSIKIFNKKDMVL